MSAHRLLNTMFLPQLLPPDLALAFVLVASGCTRERTAEAGVFDPPPVDSSRVPLADALAWHVQRGQVADLDGDGADERLVVASDVMPGPDGAPAWEDGHRWAAWVVEPETDASGDSVRTQLYGAFVPTGRADVNVTAPPVGEAPSVLVLERGGTRVATHGVRYHGPVDARSVSSATYPVLRGVPFP